MATVTEERRTDRYQFKRDAIVAAATEVLNQSGVRGFTLADVAERVGLNTPSVAYYFRRKEDLAAACLLSTFARYRSLVADALAGADGPARVRLFVEGYFALRRRVREGEEPALAIVNQVRAFKPPHSDTVMEAYVDLFRSVRRLLDTPGAPRMEPRARTARARMLFEQSLWSANRMASYDAADYPRVAQRFADIVINGLAAPGRQWAPRALAPLGAGAADSARDAFLVAATELINEHGYRGASVEKISARLNVTKGSFYHYNEGKDDLVLACFNRSHAILGQADRAAAALTEDSWERLCAVAAALTRFQASENGPLARAMALGALAEPLRYEVTARHERVADRFAAVISEGIAQSSLRAVDPLLAGQLFMTMIGSTAGLSLYIPDVRADELPELCAKPMLMGLFV
jgi:AcrR family transcriptional regulator